MSLLDRILGLPEKRDLEGLGNPNIPFGELLSAAGLGGDEAASSVIVTPEKAMTVMAFFACVRLLSNTIGSLELFLYQRQGRGRSLVDDDPRSDILLYDANPRDSASAFQTYEMLCLCVWGVAYSWLETDASGDVVAMWPIRPTRIMPAKNPAGAPIWVVRNDDQSTSVFLPEEVQRIAMFGLDMGGALAPYRAARQALGISKAAEEFAARTFQGSRPAGVIMHDKPVSDEQWATIKSAWDGRHLGLKNSPNIGLLPQSVSYAAVEYDPAPYQHIEAREFEVAEMGRMFGIPLHYLGIANASTTYASVDAQSLDFVNFTLRPYLKLIAQARRKYLFSLPADVARRLFVEHDDTPLLRTDAVSRAKIQAVQRMWSLRTANEIREDDGESPMPGGDLLWAPVTAAPIGDDGQFIETPPTKLKGLDPPPVDPNQPVPDQPVISDGEASVDPLRDLEAVDTTVKHTARVDTRSVE